MPSSRGTSDQVLWGDGQRVRGLNTQPGFFVLRPGYIAFLPTQPERNLAGGLALVAAGFVRIDGKAARYDLKGLWLKGPEAFDEAVRSWAVECVEPDEVEIIVGEVYKAGKNMVVRRDADNQWICQLRTADPDPLLVGWKRGRPRFDAPQMKKVFAVISFFPALFATICGIVAYFGDDWTVWFGVPFWGILVVFAWGGYFVAKRRHEKNHGPDPES